VQRGRPTVYPLHKHLVFVTNYPHPVFTGEMLTSWQHLMADICAGLGGELREFNGQTDHVHLLVHYPPSLAVSMLVNRLNGVSSRRLPQQYPTQVRKFLWESTSGHRLTSPPPAAAHP
jgi:putative transposase